MKLIEALKIIATRPEQSQPFKVALVSGFTPLHLQTFLQAELQLLFPSHQVEIITGSFGDIRGTLQGLKDKEIDALVLTLEWEDLDARLGIRQLGGWGVQSFEDILEQVRLQLSALQLLLEEISERVPVAISLPTLPLPPLFFTSGWQSGVWELKLREQLAVSAALLGQRQRIRFVSDQRVGSLSPTSERLSVKSAWAAGFPYQLPHASALAGLLAKIIENPQPKKGLITDLDGTLWSGIVGEVGVQGVHWDLDHNAQGHGLYQQFLKELAEEGVLLAVASKNDPGNVEEAFTREDLLLPASSVFPFEVSWGSKARAVSSILAAWNVAPDSVVFIDDDSFELAEVQATHPEVTCFRFPRHEPGEIYELLVQLRDLFGKSAISPEDQLRLESLRRAPPRPITATAESFSEALLEQTEAELTLSLRKDAKDTRALDLINKTNQFNLNGKRFTEAAWQQFLEHEDTFVLTATYKDRFGLLGKIAVIAGRRTESTLLIQSWVMSCRAFARRIEHQCLKFLFEKFGSQSTTLEYAKTAKNSPFTSFLTEFIGGPPEAAAELSKDRFDAGCPRLFHKVLELNDE